MLAEDPSAFGLIYILKFSCNFTYFIVQVSKNTSSNCGNTTLYPRACLSLMFTTYPDQGLSQLKLPLSRSEPKELVLDLKLDHSSVQERVWFNEVQWCKSLGFGDWQILRTRELVRTVTEPWNGGTYVAKVGVGNLWILFWEVQPPHICGKPNLLPCY
jgi:hypothetical protein